MSMPTARKWTSGSTRCEIGGMAVVLLLVVFSYFLGHGMTKGMYDQFANEGSPPTAMGPVGDAGRNQLGPWGYFWSERAFHYRTTLMFAVDDHTSSEVLSNDTAHQYPEGINAWKQYTLLMEPVYGQLFRWFGREGEILAEFLTRLIPLLNALLLLPVYFWARGMGARPLLGVLAVAVLATSSMTYDRFSGSLLLKENFALFWLAVFMATAIWADRRRSIALLLIAAVSLVVLLASWHLSQFLVLVVLGATALASNLRKDQTLSSDRRRWNVVKSSVYLLAALASGLTPSLWAKGFWLSLTMMLIAAWFICTLVVRSRKLDAVPILGSRTGFLVVAFLVLGGMSFLNQHYSGDYNHLFGLLKYKLIHGLARPADPTQLPFDVRVFWVSPFNSPSLATIWAKLGYHVFYLFPALIAGSFLFFRPILEPRQRAIMLMTSAFLVGFILIERLGVVYLPFAAVALAVLLEYALGNLEQKRGWQQGTSKQGALLVWTLLVMTSAGNLLGPLSGQLQAATDVAQGRPVYIAASDQDYWGFRNDLLRWLMVNTPGPHFRYGDSEPLAVVGDIGISTQVLLYTGRPVVLNSQFENQVIRDRYRQYLEALFSTNAQDLAQFLDRTQAGYLFINRNLALVDSPGSAAYMAGQKGPMRLDMTIARLHFRPEEIDYLQPVYNNEYFRLFKVVDPEKKPQERLTWERNYGNWWNLEHFTVSDGAMTSLAENRGALVDFEHSLVELQQAQSEILRSQGGRQPALPQLQQQYMELKLDLLTAQSEQKDARAIERQLQQTVAAIQGVLAAPNPAAQAPMGQALAGLFTRGPGAGQPGWRELIPSPLMEPTHLAAAAQLAALLGQYGQAADLMVKAAESFPMIPTINGDGRIGREASPLVNQIRQTAVWYCLAANRVDQARQLASTYLEALPPGSRSAALFLKVAAISKI